MQPGTIGKLTLAVAMLSLIGNYLQFLYARRQATDVQMQINLLQVEHRIRTMRDRADAFYALILGTPRFALHRQSKGMEANEYKIEYAVKVPEQKQQEFVEWMGSAKEEPLTISGPRYGYTAGYRETNEGGREVGELYQEYSLGPYPW